MTQISVKKGDQLVAQFEDTQLPELLPSALLGDTRLDDDALGVDVLHLPEVQALGLSVVLPGQRPLPLGLCAPVLEAAAGLQDDDERRVFWAWAANLHRSLEAYSFATDVTAAFRRALIGTAESPEAHVRAVLRERGGDGPSGSDYQAFAEREWAHQFVPLEGGRTGIYNADA